MNGLMIRRNTLLKRKNWLPGFSLIEIMIVIALISIIIGFIAYSVVGRMSRGQVSLARSQAYNIASTFDTYRVEFGKYPSQAEGFQPLITPPSGEPLLERIPKDPWGEEYIYVYPGVHNKNKPDIVSKGPDRAENTEDDVGNWPAGE